MLELQVLKFGVRLSPNNARCYFHKNLTYMTTTMKLSKDRNNGHTKMHRGKPTNLNSAQRITDKGGILGAGEIASREEHANSLSNIKVSLENIHSSNNYITL